MVHGSTLPRLTGEKASGGLSIAAAREKPQESKNGQPHGTNRRAMAVGATPAKDSKGSHGTESIQRQKVKTCPVVVTRKSLWRAIFRGELGQKCGFGERKSD